MDVVYTWVDDRWPGYQKQLAQHAPDAYDHNPSRTRDNVALLKYSLRSLERYAPWVERIYLVTMRPQVPDWLDVGRADVEVVHHDSFMPADILPTFHSFAIHSRLDQLPGPGERFVLFDDDMLLTGPTSADDFIGENGEILLFRAAQEKRPPERRFDEASGEWDRIAAYCNYLIHEAYGPKVDVLDDHYPVVVDRTAWTQMRARWPEDFERIEQNRFRKVGLIEPDYLYPRFLASEGLGRVRSLAESQRLLVYHELDNSALRNLWTYIRMRFLPGVFRTLNDGFGPLPTPQGMATSRWMLEWLFPKPSRFERPVEA